VKVRPVGVLPGLFVSLYLYGGLGVRPIVWQSALFEFK
jgi:hypothetical protein